MQNICDGRFDDMQVTCLTTEVNGKVIYVLI